MPRQSEPDDPNAPGGYGPQDSATATTATPRFHELDALRASAMLLGIVLHAAIFLIPGAWDEEYPHEVSGVYTLVFFAIHGFRMPVFFLLSGFFTAMLWQRRGLRQLGKHRLKRIGLPLIIGCFTILPITALIAIPDEFELIWWPFVWLSGLQHLWFLWFLLWMAGGFMLAIKLGVKFSHPVMWWLAIPLTLGPQLLMREEIFGPDTSAGLVFSPTVLGYYTLFFVFGAFFYQRNIVIRQWWTAALLPAVALVLPAGLAFLYEVQTEWSGPVAAVLQTGYAWLVCFGMMGLFRWIAARQRAWVRYISDASYWLYLWHLALVVAGYKLILDWPISIHLKFLLICVAVTGILLVIYQLGVRYTPIGAMLNGKRVRGA